MLDFLRGKEKKIKADPLAGQVNEVGASGLSMLQSGANNLNKLYGNPEGFVNNQIDLENRAIRNASDDAARRTRELIAQRGMGTSSIGLGQEANMNRDMNEKLSLNNASGLQRLKGLYGEQMQAGQGLFNTKIQGNQNLQMQQAKYRTGGLAPLLGMAAGAYIGSKSGNALGGAQIGSGLGQMYANS
jgi:hypothetical protein